MKKIYKIAMCFLLLQSCKNNNKANNTETRSHNHFDTTISQPKIDSSGKSSTGQNMDLLIQPGSAIGNTKLFEPSADLVEKLGSPDVSDAGMGKALMLWKSKNMPAYFVQIFCTTNMGSSDEVSRIQSIRVNSPDFKTENGIGRGDNIKDILKKFPNTIKAGFYKDSTGDKMIIYDDLIGGIGFETYENGKCQSIFVHSSNEEANYAPLFEGFTFYN